jgi:hypothetical protein
VKVYQHTKAEVAIRVAISQMPYGGLQAISSVAGKVGIRDGSPGPVDLEDVRRVPGGAVQDLGQDCCRASGRTLPSYVS